MSDKNWCVIQQENHPDRIIEEIFGPYSETEAKTFVDASEKSSRNFNGTHRLYNFEPREMLSC